MNYKCKKCFSNKFFIKRDGCHNGLYCINCGTFHKWATKSEIDLLKYRGQIVSKNQEGE